MLKKEVSLESLALTFFQAQNNYSSLLIFSSCWAA